MAPLKVTFRPEARADIDEASIAYMVDGDGRLLDRFYAAIDDAAHQIASFPLSGPAYIPKTRRILLDTFPYWLYYRITSETVDVLAVIHAKRNPEFLHQRSESSGD